MKRNVKFLTMAAVLVFIGAIALLVSMAVISPRTFVGKGEIIEELYPLLEEISVTSGRTGERTPIFAVAGVIYNNDRTRSDVMLRIYNSHEEYASNENPIAECRLSRLQDSLTFYDRDIRDKLRLYNSATIPEDFNITQGDRRHLHYRPKIIFLSNNTFFITWIMRNTYYAYGSQAEHALGIHIRVRDGEIVKGSTEPIVISKINLSTISSPSGPALCILDLAVRNIDLSAAIGFAPNESKAIVAITKGVLIMDRGEYLLRTVGEIRIVSLGNFEELATNNHYLESSFMYCHYPTSRREPSVGFISAAIERQGGGTNIWSVLTVEYEHTNTYFLKVFKAEIDLRGGLGTEIFTSTMFGMSPRGIGGTSYYVPTQSISVYEPPIIRIDPNEVNPPQIVYRYRNLSYSAEDRPNLISVLAVRCPFIAATIQPQQDFSYFEKFNPQLILLPGNKRYLTYQGNFRRMDESPYNHIYFVDLNQPDPPPGREIVSEQLSITDTRRENVGLFPIITDVSSSTDAISCWLELEEDPKKFEYAPLPPLSPTPIFDYTGRPEELTTVIPDVKPPTAPTNLGVTGTTESSISLKWGISTDNRTPSERIVYDVWCSRGRGFWDPVVITGPGITTATVRDLNPGTTYYFKVRAYDEANNPSSDSNEVSGTTTVAPPPPPSNRWPVLNTIGDKSVDENVRLSFRVSATDSDGDPLTYSTGSLPRGAEFDTATRTFSWTPGYDQAGSYTVTFSVFDRRGGRDDETITITVRDVNRLPIAVVTVSPNPVDEGAVLTLDGSGSSDPDGDSLTYSWRQSAGTPTSFSGIVSTARHTFTAPAVSRDTILTFELTISDGRSDVSSTVGVTIRDVPPELPGAFDITTIELVPLNTIRLVWSSSARAEGYRIHRTTLPGGPETTITPVSPTDTTYTDPGLSPGSYRYVIEAYNRGGSIRSAQRDMDVPLPPPAGLVSLWRMNTSELGIDSGPGSRNMLTNGGGVTSTSGRVGNAGQFNGRTGSYLEISDTSQTGLDQAGDITITCWIRLNSLSGHSPIVSKYDVVSGGGGSGRSYELAININGTVNWAVSNDGYNVHGGSVTTSNILVEGWYHIVAVRDGAILKVYVNGIEMTGPGWPNPFPYPAIFDSSAPFRIGSTFNHSNYFDGVIDEVAIFNRALTPAEIVDIAESGI